MKHSVTGERCLLYLESMDEKEGVFTFIGQQNKPVVIVLSGRSRHKAFQRPEDFIDLKRVKRILGLPIMFVIPQDEHLRQLATRNGFPASTSVEALSMVTERGQAAPSRQQTVSRTPSPRVSEERVGSVRKTVPLSPAQAREVQQHALQNGWPTIVQEEEISSRKTEPLISLPQHTALPGSPSTAKSPPLPQLTPLPLSHHPVRPVPKKRRNRLPSVLIVLSLLVLAGAGSGSFLLSLHALPVAVNTTSSSSLVQVVGRIYFLSSEQVSENSSQGIDDEVLLDLHTLVNPTSGKSYYAWLLGDKNQAEAHTFYLGKLTPHNGSVHLLYTGDQQHTNLLALASRFLLTEEDATTPPITPSPDYGAWRYYGEFPQAPDPLDNVHHFSYLDHLRHLLAADPTLNEMELPGGLNNWLFRNTDKLIEWTVSARDRWEEKKDLGFVRRQITRALIYLDGMSFVQQDLPSGTLPPNGEHLAAIGLLSMNGPNQTPPSYLDHIVFHLNGLLQAPGSTPALRESAAQIVAALSNVRSWLRTLHDDARQIVAMPDDQLSQEAAFTLLNEIVDMANNAYAGQIDPATGGVREGVLWIHNHMQSLATFEMSQYIASRQTPEIIPTKPMATLLFWK